MPVSCLRFIATLDVVERRASRFLSTYVARCRPRAKCRFSRGAIAAGFGQTIGLLKPIATVRYPWMVHKHRVVLDLDV